MERGGIGSLPEPSLGKPGERRIRDRWELFQGSGPHLGKRRHDHLARLSPSLGCLANSEEDGKEKSLRREALDFRQSREDPVPVHQGFTHLVAYPNSQEATQTIRDDAGE